MIFQSFSFLLYFLPTVVFLYYVTPTNNLRNIVLIISSLIFYAWGNPLWAILLLGSSIVDFAIAQKIHNLNSQEEEKIHRQKKFLLLVSIIFNVGLLAFFKYWDWIIGLISQTTKIDLTALQHHIPLPPAISFYTFETLSYTIDIYRRQFRPTKNFIDYLTFISFFPKLVAGPIKRAHELLPQLVKFRKRISSRALELAFFMICWGLFKKLVFADNLGHLVNRCRENIATPGVGLLLAVAFTFQLYCDFSAYADIARGTARLFAIRLRRNFLTPYLSTNPVEFFQRWNITLSSWIRDYIYIPLGGSRRGILRNIFNIYFTMLIFGLWHGAGIFFAMYGLYSATVIIFYRLVPIDRLLVKFLGKIGKILSMPIIFSFIIFGMMIFWVKTPEDFFAFSNSFFQSIKVVSGLVESENFFKLGYILLLLTLPILVTDILGYRKNREFIDLYIGLKTLPKIFLYLTMFYLTLFFASRGSYDFIYFQF